MPRSIPMIVPLRCSSSSDSDSASTSCGSADADAKNTLKEMQCNKTHKIVAAESQEQECLFIVMLKTLERERVMNG